MVFYFTVGIYIGSYTIISWNYRGSNIIRMSAHWLVIRVSFVFWSYQRLKIVWLWRPACRSAITEVTTVGQYCVCIIGRDGVSVIWTIAKTEHRHDVT